MSILQRCLLLSLTFAGGCAILQPTRPATEWTPESRTARVEAGRTAHGDYYAGRMEGFVAALPAGRDERGGTVWLGDSLVERFPLEEVFADPAVLNRGIGGDKTFGVEERLDVSLAPYDPEQVFLLVGINETIWLNWTDEEFAARYRSLLEAIEQTAPRADITMLAMLPLGERFDEHAPKVTRRNPLLAALAAEKGATFVDATEALSDEEGRLLDEYTTDEIHLNTNGYVRLLELLTPDDEELMERVARLAADWARLRANPRPIDKIDPPADAPYGGRSADTLIVFTPAGDRETTGTNQWGLEATVRDGRIVAIGGNDSPIPDDGFVISGHGSANQWIANRLHVGQEVRLEGMGLLVVSEAGGEMANERLAALDAFFTAQAAGDMRAAEAAAGHYLRAIGR